MKRSERVACPSSFFLKNKSYQLDISYIDLQVAVLTMETGEESLWTGFYHFGNQLA